MIDDGAYKRSLFAKVRPYSWIRRLGPKAVIPQKAFLTYLDGTIASQSINLREKYLFMFLYT